MSMVACSLSHTYHHKLTDSLLLASHSLGQLKPVRLVLCRACRPSRGRGWQSSSREVLNLSMQSSCLVRRRLTLWQRAMLQHRWPRQPRWRGRPRQCRSTPRRPSQASAAV